MRENETGFRLEAVILGGRMFYACSLRADGSRVNSSSNVPRKTTNNAYCRKNVANFMFFFFFPGYAVWIKLKYCFI